MYLNACFSLASPSGDKLDEVKKSHVCLVNNCIYHAQHNVWNIEDAQSIPVK